MNPMLAYGAFGLAKSAMLKLIMCGVVVAVLACGMKIVWDLQASAARKVKISVLTQVAKNKTRVAALVNEQRAYEDSLKVKQREAVERARALPVTDTEACPLEWLRCEQPPS